MSVDCKDSREMVDLPVCNDRFGKQNSVGSCYGSQIVNRSSFSADQSLGVGDKAAVNMTQS